MANEEKSLQQIAADFKAAIAAHIAKLIENSKKS